MKKLTRDEVVDLFRDKYGTDISKGLCFKVVDHFRNFSVPERYSYEISYVCQLTGWRKDLTYWPINLW